MWVDRHSETSELDMAWTQGRVKLQNVFSLFLNVLSVSALVMSDSKLFYILAAATGNA
jgi:hypothetical protein